MAQGPIWFPTNFLLIESFRKLGRHWAPNSVYKRHAQGGNS